MTTLNLNLKQSFQHQESKINFEAWFTGLAAFGLATGIIFQIMGFHWFAMFAYGLVYISGGLPAAIGALKELYTKRLWTKSPEVS